MSDARPAFRFFTLVPNQSPDRAGTHNDVPVSMVVDPAVTKSIRRMLLTSSEACGLSGRPSLIYPHIRLITECLLSTKHQEPSDWWLPLAANLGPLPPSLGLYS